MKALPSVYNVRCGPSIIRALQPGLWYVRKSSQKSGTCHAEPSPALHGTCARDKCAPGASVGCAHTLVLAPQGQCQGRPEAAPAPYSRYGVSLREDKLREGSPANLSRSAQIAGDYSVVAQKAPLSQNDIKFLILGTLEEHSWSFCCSKKVIPHG